MVKKLLFSLVILPAFFVGQNLGAYINSSDYIGYTHFKLCEDKNFVEWSKHADMDGMSVFRDNLFSEEYRQRVCALNDEDFVDLMVHCKIWHGGVPFLVVVNCDKKDILYQFWNRIKQMPTDKILQVLNAEYCGVSFLEYIEKDFFKSYVPADVKQEIDVFVGKK